MTSDGAAAQPEHPEREEAARRPYSPPRLEALGDLRELTLGPSPGIGDSLDPGTRKTPGL